VVVAWKKAPSRHLPGGAEKELNACQDIRSPSRDLNLVNPEYEAELRHAVEVVILQFTPLSRPLCEHVLLLFGEIVVNSSLLGKLDYRYA
jgi:hypothetical protein